MQAAVSDRPLFEIPLSETAGHMPDSLFFADIVKIALLYLLYFLYISAF